ncbi:MAG: VOC family protein [Trueperaceae bacterium]|nr:VOC family protein [Trueperaceae bacterium]
MRPRISVVTLGVDDLAAAVRFYRDGLGLATEGIVGTDVEHGAVAFFDLEGGLKLALFGRVDIAHDSGVPLGARSVSEYTLGHNVHSRAEVEAIMAVAHLAGATISQPARDTAWGGYAGSFQDPDGHVWEVVWNPSWETPAPEHVV